MTISNFTSPDEDYFTSSKAPEQVINGHCIDVALVDCNIFVFGDVGHFSNIFFTSYRQNK